MREREGRGGEGALRIAGRDVGECQGAMSDARNSVIVENSGRGQDFMGGEG